MTFKEVLAQVIDWLRENKRISYRALKRQFDLDDDYVEDLKVELIEVQEIATDRDNKMLVWSGETEVTPVSASQPVQTSEQPDIQQDQPAQIESPPEPVVVK